MRIEPGDELLLRVLERYPLDRPRVTERLEASYRNENFVVEDAASRRFVLRRYRRNPDERRVRFQLEFQRQLSQLGFPTSEIVASNAGDVLVGAEAGPWVLFTLVEGEEFDYARLDQVEEAGRRLAQFHTASERIELPEVAVDINPEPRRWWTDGEELLGEIEAMCAGQGVEEELAFLGRWQRELVAQVPLSAFDALPTGWVHGDYHGRNMVFVGGELRGLFDFDPLFRGRYLDDIPIAAFRFGREKRASLTLRPEVARLFLDAYESIRPLTLGERSAFVAFGPLGWMETAAYYRMLRDDGEDWLTELRLYVARMRRAGEELRRLPL
jgi:Ser/Thr protein kinase RdoA (MazF antagonist)